MKKFASILAAVAMSAVMAVSAFAAQADVDNLKGLVNGAKGVTAAEKATAIAFIDEYAVKNADKITATTVSELTAVYNEAVSSKPEARTTEFVTGLVNRAQKTLADAGITVSIENFVVGNGRAVISGSVSAPGVKTATFNFSKSATAPSNGSTAGAAAPVSNAGKGVIKSTGVDATSVVVMAVALVSVLGGAVIGVRKMGLLAQ